MGGQKADAEDRASKSRGNRRIFSFCAWNIQYLAAGTDDDDDADHQDSEVDLCNCEIIGICVYKGGYVHWVTTFEVETVEAWNVMFDNLSSDSVIDFSNCNILYIDIINIIILFINSDSP